PTAPAPTAHAGSEGQRLRPQSGERAAAAAPQSGMALAQGAWTSLPKKRKVMAAAGVAVLLGAIVALGASHGSAPPGADAALPKAEPAVVDAVAPAAASPAAVAPAAASPVGRAPEPAPNALTEQNGIVSADVPLFGATPMATMEPAPLAPPPGSDKASEEAAEKAAAKASVSAAAADEA